MEPIQTSAEYDDEARNTFLRNYETLHAVLSGGRAATMGVISEQGHDLTLRLERILVDEQTKGLVPFTGAAGIEALIDMMSRAWPEHARIVEDGHLVGLVGTLTAEGADWTGRLLPETEEGDTQTIAVSVGVGPAGQLIASVGPSANIALIDWGLAAFDRTVHVCARELGMDYSLVAEGYNPLARMPLDLELVPLTRWTLMNAHLGQCGRYARDMMRCTCATQIVLSYGNEREAIGSYRLACALSPLLVFLTDNVRSFRASGARRCPRMVRSLIWEEVDPSRSGVVPGTFDRDMSFDRYIEWLMGTQPIAMTDAMGTTTSSGKKTVREVLSERVLSGSEALRLFDTVYPSVRLGKDMELLQADSLRPRMATGYAAFIKGIFSNPLARDDIWSRLVSPSDQNVELAAHELRMRGWDATIYGCRVRDLVHALIEAARSTLDTHENRLMNAIAELWEVEMVPRDEFVTQEIRANRGW